MAWQRAQERARRIREHQERARRIREHQELGKEPGGARKEPRRAPGESPGESQERARREPKALIRPLKGV